MYLSKLNLIYNETDYPNRVCAVEVSPDLAKDSASSAE
jgi:hypothetical protein